MKYLTKDCFEAMKRSSLHFMLKASKKAETFSEDYYKSIYKRKETDYLNIIKAGLKLKFEDIFPEEPRGELFNESEEAKKTYLEQRDQARIRFANRPVDMDFGKARALFKQTQNARINHWKKNLPENILHKVADIRVLALGVASPEVKREIVRYCKRNEKRVKSAINAYETQYQKQFESDEPSFAQELGWLHDSKVLSCRKKRNDIVLTVDNSGSFSNVCKIRFVNCNIIKKDCPLHGAMYKYNEIYKSGEGYEIHFLLIILKSQMLIDFIVYADTLEYSYDR